MVERIKAFVTLGEVLKTYQSNPKDEFSEYYSLLDLTIQKAKAYNPWFTSDNVLFALHGIGESLSQENMQQWLHQHMSGIEELKSPQTVAVIMAGNIPLVGFHDFLCVVLSGNNFLGKLSSDDEFLLPAVSEILTSIESSLKDQIEFADGKIQKFDAVIATGSNNTSRYFDYYFGKYPHIIRKNRNGVAVITGDESAEELNNLGHDVFRYFGMGCRSISKFFVPRDYSFNLFFESIESFSSIGNHNKYKNNYDYYRSIYLINKVKHFDNGFLMITEDTPFASPPSVIYFEHYDDVKSLNTMLNNEMDNIQCIVSSSSEVMNAIPPGKAQQPDLWDYADGVDTIWFLVNLLK